MKRRYIMNSVVEHSPHEFNKKNMKEYRKTDQVGQAYYQHTNKMTFIGNLRNDVIAKYPKSVEIE